MICKKSLGGFVALILIALFWKHAFHRVATGKIPEPVTEKAGIAGDRPDLAAGLAGTQSVFEQARKPGKPETDEAGKANNRERLPLPANRFAEIPKSPTRQADGSQAEKQSTMCPFRLTQLPTRRRRLSCRQRVSRSPCRGLS